MTHSRFYTFFNPKVYFVYFLVHQFERRERKSSKNNEREKVIILATKIAIHNVKRFHSIKGV